MAYHNIGIYKYGERCTLTLYNGGGDLSNTKYSRKNGIQLHEFLRTKDVIYKLIILFHDSYYDTDIDIATFGKEFYNTVGFLRNGIIPLELDFLAIDEKLDEIEDILKDATRK